MNRYRYARWKHAVMEIDDWRCQVCGTTKHLDAAHIIPRRHFATRYDPTNGVVLCRRHHEYFHEHPAEFKLWVETFLKANRVCP